MIDMREIREFREILLGFLDDIEDQPKFCDGDCKSCPLALCSTNPFNPPVVAIDPPRCLVNLLKHDVNRIQLNISEIR
jgi:hypothetical protein